jgi:hypothetical protein
MSQSEQKLSESMTVNEIIVKIKLPKTILYCLNPEYLNRIPITA